MPESKVEELQKQLGIDWPNLSAARLLTATRRQEMEPAVEGFSSADVSVVMFGSFARDELTPGSDPDWSLLVDGAADPHHFETAQAVGKKIVPLFVKDAGREKTFGTPSFSHDLVHLIGGQDDTNRNTTRRILLLLESSPVGRREAYDRVVNCVLDRYVLEDRTFAGKKARNHVPRF
ncbi:MAG: nucleotidyltransferase domain-containing protein, partial [Polyangiaceae bacterium]|nr:nucleotidyltransferase domain-containing protein [Polyangiaceae bacterium]